METLNKLKEQDILELLNEYRSELRRLNFKVEDITNKIRLFESILKQEGVKGIDEDKIHEMIHQEEPREEETGTPDAVDQTPKKLKRNFPLSEWDKIIMNDLQRKGRVMVNQEILDNIREELKVKGLYKSEDKAKAKLNQCLVKLANRRGDLIKVRFEGRGFAYALPEWMIGGKLKSEHSRKS